MSPSPITSHPRAPESSAISPRPARAGVRQDSIDAVATESHPSASTTIRCACPRRLWRVSLMSRARRRPRSTAPVGCTPLRALRRRDRRDAGASARTSAATTPSTRSSAGRTERPPLSTAPCSYRDAPVSNSPRKPSPRPGSHCSVAVSAPVAGRRIGRGRRAHPSSASCGDSMVAYSRPDPLGPSTVSSPHPGRPARSWLRERPRRP